jgi:5-carboxymethyl-2-hydroxymuconate isomerase
VLQSVGELLSRTARAHLAPALGRRHFGLTLQIDEGAEAVDVKFGNLHPLFTPS